MTTIRCSSLPLAWACPSSQEVVPGEVVLNQSSEPAECGTAFHRWIAGHIKGEDLDSSDLAKQHGCDEDELSMLCAMGRKAWDKIRPMLGECVPETEVPLDGHFEGVSIAGTADVLAAVKNRILVVDWKTGRVDSDYNAQLMGYAHCAMSIDESYTDATIITVWVRQGQWDVVHVTWKQAESWAQELARRIRNGLGTFNPGAHCQYCRRAGSCPGRREMVRAACADLQVVEWTPETRLAAGPKIGETLGRMRVIETAIEQFRAAVKADVMANGPLPTGPGRQLAILTVNKRDLNATKARPVLSQWLTPEEIDAETTISAAGCEAAAVAKAPKGQGAATKRAIAAALETAGAVVVNEVKQLRESKA